MTITDQGTAHDTLTQLVADALIGEYGAAQFATPSEVLAALLDGGSIREEWGARLHAGEPDGDVDTWRDTRAKAEAMIAARARAKGGWPEPSSLIRRYVIVTAPTVVEAWPDGDPIVYDTALTADDFQETT